MIRESDFIIVGDEAYLPEEWARIQRRYERQRAYRARPEVKVRRAALLLSWKERNRDHLREYNREWMRRWRAER